MAFVSAYSYRIKKHSSQMWVLLLAPNGLGKTWDFWSPNSDDTAFADAVIEDAAMQHPIDRSKIFISGYSYGSEIGRASCRERV